MAVKTEWERERDTKLVVSQLKCCLFRGVRAVPQNCRYPDTIAVCYSSVDNKLTCIYNDHSLYIWDVADIRKVGKTRSFLFHSGAVWGIDVSCSLPVAAPCGLFVIHKPYILLWLLLLVDLHRVMIINASALIRN